MRYIVLLSLVVAAALLGFGPAGAADSATPAPRAEVREEAQTPDQALGLALPAPDGHRDYLGLPADAQSFHLRDIPTRCLVVQVFSAYCHHCQAEAPDVNAVFERLKQVDPERLRFVALGANNTGFEIDMFQSRYQTAYPLVADEDMEASLALGAQVTPTYVILDTGTEPAKVLHTLEGRFESSQDFVETVLDVCKP